MEATQLKVVREAQVDMGQDRVVAAMEVLVPEVAREVEDLEAVDPEALDQGALDWGALDRGALDQGTVDPEAVGPEAVDPDKEGAEVVRSKRPR